MQDDSVQEESVHEERGDVQEGGAGQLNAGQASAEQASAGQPDARRVATETARELIGLWSMLHRLNGSGEHRAFGLAYRDVERYLRRCGLPSEEVQSALTAIQFEYPEPEF